MDSFLKVPNTQSNNKTLNFKSKSWYSFIAFILKAFQTLTTCLKFLSLMSQLGNVLKKFSLLCKSPLNFSKLSQ